MDHTILQDRYRIDSELGRGGMGVVYQGHDTLLGRDVAIKVLANTGLGTEGRARLLHEARTAARLSHPNIVTVYDAGQAEDTPFIVMELLPGLSLHEQRPQSMNEIVDIAQQICAALEHAHGQEIIHRDLKPENVMLLPPPSKGEESREGVTVKLMDFGLARSVTTRLTAEGTIMGTFSYLAPEIALGREIDGRADLYALGVMLYELTTGELPFTDLDPVAVISQHLHAPVVPPRAKNPDIPSPFEGLIVRLLAKEPDGRPGSAAEVRQALERVASPEVPTKPEPGLAELDCIVRGRFVGREAELAEARAVWHQALAGQGQVLLISGEPGIGKTRLVEELVTQATVTGGLAFIGASYAEGGSPYTPFRQILREALGGDSDNGFTLPDTVMADLLALAPELRPADGDLTAEHQIEGQQLLDSMVVLFTQMSNKAPLLLVLEDAHWADSGSLALIRHLARNMRQQPLLIVATYREVEVEEARSFHELLVDFGRERIGRRIKLTQLDPGGTHELLATLLAAEITPDFLEGIYRETEGNPFFVEEVCKALIASGKLTYQKGRWRRPSMAELGVPQSIQVTIQSRVRALPQATQKALEQAAIFGREFDFDTLVRAAGAVEDDLIDALEEAEQAQLIEETGLERGGTFAFVHALIPTTLVTSMRTLRRRRLHGRAAAALEAEYPEAYEALAYQFIEAGETEKGIAYLLKAGDRARTLYAHQEAIDSYQQALDYLREQGDLEQAARVQMKLALAYHNALDFTQSQQAYQQGFELWQRIGPAGLAAQLPPAPHPLRVALLEPATLDPGLDVGPAAPIIDHLFSGLTRMSPEMDVLPDVAHSWEMTDGGSRYKFYLRNEVTWSDGVRVTAGDFEFAWKRMLNPATESPLANLLYDIKNAEPFHQGRGIDASMVGVRVLDDFTLEVELEGPTSYFLSLLALVAYPVPSHVVRQFGKDWARSDGIVTNGPFRLTAWVAEQDTDRPKMIFERNPTFHGPFSGNLERVESPLTSGENTIDSWQLYKEDRLDYYFLGGRNQQEAINARHQNAGDYLSYPVLTTGFLIFNTQRPPLDDRRVRQALAMATDRDWLANNVLGGVDFTAKGGLVPPGMPGHVAGIATPYDPGRARRLLAEAGYPGGRGLPRLEYLARFWANRLEAQNEIEFLCRGWKENLGLELDVELLPFKQFVEERSKDSSHLQDGTWVADYPDPDSFLRVALPWLHVRWRNDPYDWLVERARRIMNQEERLRLYRQAEEILIKEVPVLPLYYVRQHGLLKPWVKSFPISPIQSSIAGSHSWQDVIIEPH